MSTFSILIYPSPKHDPVHLFTFANMLSDAQRLHSIVSCTCRFWMTVVEKNDNPLLLLEWNICIDLHATQPHKMASTDKQQVKIDNKNIVSCSPVIDIKDAQEALCKSLPFLSNLFNSFICHHYWEQRNCSIVMCKYFLTAGKDKTSRYTKISCIFHSFGGSKWFYYVSFFLLSSIFIQESQ